MGHADMKTTSVYLRMTERDSATAIERLDLGALLRGQQTGGNVLHDDLPEVVVPPALAEPAARRTA